MVSWIEWVHTKSNPADALTRPGWASAAQRMGLELEEPFGLAGVQRASSNYCPAAAVGGSSGTTNFEIQWTAP